MLKTLRDKLHSRRFLYLSIFSMVLVISILLSACVLIYHNFSRVRMEEQLERQSQLLLETSLNEADSLFSSLINLSVAYSDNSTFIAEYMNSTPQTQQNCVKLLRSMNAILSKTDDMFYIAKDSPHLISAYGTYLLSIYGEVNQNVSAFVGTNALINASNIHMKNASYLTSTLTGTNILHSDKDSIELIYPVQGANALLGFKIPWRSLISVPQNGDTVILLTDSENRVLLSTDPALSAKLLTDEAPLDFNALGDHQQLVLGGAPCAVRMMESQYTKARIISITYTDRLLDELSGLDRSFIVLFLIAFAAAAVTGAFYVYMNYKPINKLRKRAESLTKTEDKHLGEIESVEQTIHSLFSQYSQLSDLNEDHRRSELVLRLANSECTEKTARECAKAGIDLQRGTKCFAILQLSDGREDSGVISRFARAMLPEFEVFAAHYNYSRGYILLLLGDQDEAALSEKITEFTHVYGANIFIGVGNAAAQVEKLCYSCVDAKDALQYAVQNKITPVFYRTDVKKMVIEHYSAVHELVSSLGYAIENANFDQSRAYLDKLYQAIKEKNELPAQLCYEIVNTMLDAAKRNVVMAEALKASTDFTYFNLHFFSAEDFWDFANRLLEIISTPIEAGRDQFGPACMLLQQYVLKPDFVPEMLADEMGIPLSALNRLFNQHCGKSVSKYMLDMRQDYAKQLLRMTDITIGALAPMLGYSQASSFIRTFKREEGVSPGEYRSSHREKQST